MPFVQRRDDHEEGDPSGLVFDIEERACPACRRFLHPWQDACPDDGSAAVPRTALPAMAQPPAHLLDDD